MKSNKLTLKKNVWALLARHDNAANEALLCSASTSQTWAQFSKLMSKLRNLDVGLIMCSRWSLTPPTSDSHPLALSLVKAAEVHSQCLHKQSGVKVTSCAVLISTAMHHHHQHSELHNSLVPAEKISVATPMKASETMFSMATEMLSCRATFLYKLGCIHSSSSPR